MTKATAPLDPPEPVRVRPPRPGLSIPATAEDGTVPPGPVAPPPPPGVVVRRDLPHMSEIWVDGALVGVVQALSSASGPWAFQYMPGWATREAAEEVGAVMCRAAVDAVGRAPGA